MKQCSGTFIATLLMLAMQPCVSADDKLDPVVDEMKSILQSRGFPRDMFKQNQQQVDAIQINTTWWAFEPALARAFRRRFPNAEQPVGNFYQADSFLSANADFEEAVMRAVWPDGHRHLRVVSSAATNLGIPAELKREFQTRTRVDFPKLAGHIQSMFRDEGLNSLPSYAPEEPRTQCYVTTEYRQPPAGLHPWYRENMEWAIRIRVEQTTGEHKTVAASHAFSSPKSRIVLHGYIVAHAKNENRAIEVGPVFENSFRTNGSSEFNLIGEGWRLVPSSKEGHMTSGGIQLNGPFAGRSPLLLMMNGSAVLDYVAPYQLKIANSLLADSSLHFGSAEEPVAKRVTSTQSPATAAPAPSPRVK